MFVDGTLLLEQHHTKLKITTASPSFLFENLCSFKGQIVTGQTHTQHPPRPPPNSGAFILSLFLEESSRTAPPAQKNCSREQWRAGVPQARLLLLLLLLLLLRLRREREVAQLPLLPPLIVKVVRRKPGVIGGSKRLPAGRRDAEPR